MSDATNERPGEAGLYAPQGIGWHLENVLREKTSLEWDLRLRICEEFFFRSKAATLQADCERWSAQYSRQADELVAVKAENNGLRVNVKYQASQTAELEDELTTLTARLAGVEQGKTCPRCDVDGYWFKATKIAEQRAEAAEQRVKELLSIMRDHGTGVGERGEYCIYCDCSDGGKVAHRPTCPMVSAAPPAAGDLSS